MRRIAPSQAFGRLALGLTGVAVAVACGEGGQPPARSQKPQGGASGATSGGAGLGGTMTGGSGASGSGAMSAGSGAQPGGAGGSSAGTSGAGSGVGAASGAGGGAGDAAGAAGSGVGGAGSGGASGSGGSGGNAGAGLHAADATFCKGALASAITQYEGFRSTYTNATQIPRSAAGTDVRFVGASDWTSGFPAGSFWLLYEYTQDQAWRTAAEARTAALEGQRLTTSTHDVGFIINTTFGKGHALTQSTAYRTVVLQAAASLATRFNATVGATRSWSFGSWSFPVIIDNMMNLELLFHATALGGEQRFADIATTHAATTLANHFRADASSYHVVDYNPTTGAVIRKQTNQGLGDETAWARGQAWGLYGFTMVYRSTHEQRFLTHALRIADFYTQSADMPADAVPYFDFDAPHQAAVPDYRDASAGAIAASGLIELAGYAPAEARERYLTFAIRALRSLSSTAYRAANGQNSRFLLMHSVGNYPQSDEVDVAINYADYYYLEGLLRCADLT